MQNPHIVCVRKFFPLIATLLYKLERISFSGYTITITREIKVARLNIKGGHYE